MQKGQTRNQTDRLTDREGSEKHTKTPTRAPTKKKNTRRGGNLGEGEEQGVRVELVVRGHEEETQGEPQTPHGVWVSQRLREREREREEREKNVVGKHTKQKKERVDTNIKANKGPVLKGTKPNNISTPKTMKPEQETS